MTDEQGEVSGLQRELNTKGLSRRQFLDRLKVMGVGFGAAGAATRMHALSATRRSC